VDVESTEEGLSVTVDERGAEEEEAIAVGSEEAEDTGGEGCCGIGSGWGCEP
jgi:hypothetical protein